MGSFRIPPEGALPRCAEPRPSVMLHSSPRRSGMRQGNRFSTTYARAATPSNSTEFESDNDEAADGCRKPTRGKTAPKSPASSLAMKADMTTRPAGISTLIVRGVCLQQYHLDARYRCNGAERALALPQWQRWPQISRARFCGQASAHRHLAAPQRRYQGCLTLSLVGAQPKVANEPLTILQSDPSLCRMLAHSSLHVAVRKMSRDGRSVRHRPWWVAIPIRRDWNYPSAPPGHPQYVRCRRSISLSTCRLHASSAVLRSSR